MVHQFKKIFGPEQVNRASQLGMSEREAVILASIIEKETPLPEEKPLVSAVFHNRLTRRMPLQSDPTVIYGIKNFNGNLTKEDLLTTDSLQHLSSARASSLPHLQSRERIPFSQPSTRPLSPTFISFPRTTGLTIFLRKLKIITGQSGNFKRTEKRGIKIERLGDFPVFSESKQKLLDKRINSH